REAGDGRLGVGASGIRGLPRGRVDPAPIRFVLHQASVVVARSPDHPEEHHARRDAAGPLDAPSLGYGSVVAIANEHPAPPSPRAGSGPGLRILVVQPTGDKMRPHGIS